MGGITAVLALLRALWPFIREAVFGHAPVRAWLKKNFFSLIWLLFVIAMFVVVLKLSTTIRSDRVQINSLNTTNTALQQSFTADEAKLAQYKDHPELVCPRSTTRGKDVHPPTVAPSTYPGAPPTKSTKQDQAVLDLLKQIRNEEH